MISTIINKTKLFLKNDTYIIKIISLSYLLFIIFNRIRLGSDQLRQLGSSVNFLTGNGFTQSFFDGNIITLSSVDDWPLFYRVFCIPFLLLFKNLEFVYLLVLLCSYILLILSINEIITRFFLNTNNKKAALNLIFISIAFCLSPFRFGSEIDIFSLSFVFFLQTKVYDYFKNGNKKIDLSLILFFLFLLINSRYAYLPFVLMFLAFLLVLDLAQKSLNKNLLIKTSGVFLILVNIFYLTQSAYFQKTTSMITDSSASGNTYWSYFYSFGFNSLFPDYVVLNLIVKTLKFDLSNYYLLFVIPVFLTSIFLVCLIIKTALERFKKGDSDFISLELLLVFSGSFNLLNMIYIFGSFKTYNKEQVDSIYSIMYSGLSVNNRYLILTFASFFILMVCYSFFSKKIFPVLIFMSVVFGVTHDAYLGFKYHFSRNKNMDFINNPKGSYSDCIEINKIISKESIIPQKQLFVQCYPNDSLNFRQITPHKLVVSSGITLFTGENSIKHYNFNPKLFEKIYFCDYKYNKKHDFKNKIFEGNVYNLYLK